MDVAHLPEDHPDRVRAEQARRALRALNFQRERLSRLDVPLVFWLSQNTLGQVMQHAADVFAARSGLFYFEALVREPTAPPPMRAEVTVQLLDRFHRTLLPPEELRQRAALYERRLERELRTEPVEGREADESHWPRVAFLCRDLANIYRELDDYERVEKFQREAIEAYQNALAEREQAEDKGQEWAVLQVWLGNAYADLPTGDRAENLERAIECYREALRVYTPEAAPLDYAMTQNNLGTAYLRLPTGDRAANLEQAIACYREALRFRTPEAAPLQYAATQNNLGIAYADLPTGDRAENLERAIECYREALRVYTPEAAPLDYAMTQNNLGTAYLRLPTGDRAANLEQAIRYVERALQIEGLAPWERADCLFTRGLIHLALGHPDQAQADYQTALPLADAITIAEALEELEEFAADHPGAPGLDAVRALFSSSS